MRRAPLFRPWRLRKRTWPLAVALVLLAPPHPVLAEPADPGRLFFTPAQRAQLEAARARAVPRADGSNQAAVREAPAPLRYDGVLIRSDGSTTRWVDGKPQLDASAVSGLKPGQIRADGKVYEPYQVLRPLPPNPAAPGEKESAP